MSDTKKDYRKTLEDRRADLRRVFSWRFAVNDERQQQARKILEEWEAQYFEETGDDVPLSEIMTDLILDMEYTKPSPRMTERRLSNMLLKRMEALEEMIRDIAERDPVVYQTAAQAHRERTGGKIEDDFISGMFDDFDNTGGR